jgi:sporulation protein YlmC with PRC-barrel domain
MPESIEFPIGTEVGCRDGVCGDLTRVVIDPVARKVTHLVVEPKHPVGAGRLVPLVMVKRDGDAVRLACSSDDFEKLEAAEETRYLPGVDADLGYGPDQAWGLPYYGLGSFGGLGIGYPEAIVYDRVPPGEIEVQRGDTVYARDGNIGKIQGVVIDPRDNQMTHVLLQEGHLWGKKEVAIPVSAVIDVKDGIRLSLTKEEVKGLPEIDIDHPIVSSKAP